MTDRRRDRERDPKPLGDVLRTMVAGRGWGERMALQRLRESWREVAGEHLSARTEPVKLFRGVLTVRAEGGAWASELTLLAAPIAAKADAFLGGSSVREVRVVAGVVRAPDEPV
jgi:hypothetical protein